VGKEGFLELPSSRVVSRENKMKKELLVRPLRSHPKSSVFGPHWAASSGDWPLEAALAGSLCPSLRAVGSLSLSNA